MASLAAQVNEVVALHQELNSIAIAAAEKYGVEFAEFPYIMARGANPDLALAVTRGQLQMLRFTLALLEAQQKGKVKK